MINLIWQTPIKKNIIKPIDDQTINQFEYIDQVVFKDIDHKIYFDNMEYKRFLENAVIIYSSDENRISNELKNYLEEYKKLNLKYVLFHVGNEGRTHDYSYYSDVEHVFRFYYNDRIKHQNVTTLPVGFVTGFMNVKNYINLSIERDIPITFIGHIKGDRFLLVNSMKKIDNNYTHLTHSWNSPNNLSTEKIINIYKRTKFLPSPMGNVSVDCLRLYEGLEWGCIPIIKKYNGIDYYKNIFGNHPMPVIDNWHEIENLIKKLDNNLDDLILSINSWYRKAMSDMSKNVGSIIRQHFTKII